ncbi:MAG: hypothetical protein E7321_09455 [Clostridiales bacterium]|nr:hypothetical protein [Clostridiales bacterium]
MIMQGYDMEAAVEFIARVMRKAGHKNPQQELEDFVRRAIEADMAYMREIDVIDEDGLMGEGEYDDDDAFEALLDRLGEDVQDDDEMNQLAQLLDSFMAAQQDFMDASGLME